MHVSPLGWLEEMRLGDCVQLLRRRSYQPSSMTLVNRRYRLKGSDTKRDAPFVLGQKMIVLLLALMLSEPIPQVGPQAKG